MRCCFRGAGCGVCVNSSSAQTSQMPTGALGKESLSLRVCPAAAFSLGESLTLRVYTEYSLSPAVPAHAAIQKSKLWGWLLTN